MKSLVSLCVCTMLLSCAHQQQPTEQQQELKTDLIALNLKGKVKKITRYDYYFGEGADSITSGVLVDTYPPIEFTEFNPQGFITLRPAQPPAIDRHQRCRFRWQTNTLSEHLYL